jgi:hypothetical protein
MVKFLGKERQRKKGKGWKVHVMCMFRARHSVVDTRESGLTNECVLINPETAFSCASIYF